MTEEERKANEEAINKEKEQFIADQIAQVNKLYIEERNTLIPVVFGQVYFYSNGIEAYDKLQEEKVVFVNHPYLKICRDKKAARLAQEK